MALENDVQDTVEDELRARRLRAGGLGRPPRRRGAVVAVAVTGALLSLGVVLGIRALGHAGPKVEASTAELRNHTDREQNIVLPAIDSGVSPPAPSDRPR